MADETKARQSAVAGAMADEEDLENMCFCETNPNYCASRTASIHLRCNGLCWKKLSWEIGFVWRENGRSRAGRPRHQGRNAERNMPYYQTNPPFYVGVFDAMVSMQGICEEVLRRIRWVRFRKTNPPEGVFLGGNVMQNVIMRNLWRPGSREVRGRETGAQRGGNG